MAKSTIIQKSEEVVKETVGNVATGVKNEVTESAREAFAQLLGVPLPDSKVSEMKQQDAQQSSAQIADVQGELSRLQGQKPQESPVATIRRKDIGISPEQAQNQLKQTLFSDAQRLGQTNETSEEQRKAWTRQQEEEEKARKDKEERDRFAAPMSLPGSRAQSAPTSRPVVNQRQQTGETLKKRDT